MKNDIKKIAAESIRAKEALISEKIDNIVKAAELLIASLEVGGKLLIFGNGGSAADSQHMVAELVGRFKKERQAWPAIALTTNTSTMTALANDYSYDEIFARQIDALGKPGDVVIGISTSGNSKNVIEAVRRAKALGLKTIALTGGDGGKLARECDIAVAAPSKNTPRIQECHLLIIHILCELIENALAK